MLCSGPERARLKVLLDLGLIDTRGLRIDLILASKALAAQCSGATIDVAPRKLEKPSDHAPVVAVL